MDLDFTAAEDTFRAEAREWLAAHVPASPLPSLETAEGFAAHRAWEGPSRPTAGRWSPGPPGTAAGTPRSCSG